MTGRTIIPVPLALAATTRFAWDIDWRGQTAGPALNGGTVTVYNAAPRWVGRPVLALNRDAILRWRALRAAARGRAHLYLMPLVDPLGARDMAPALGGEAQRLGLPLAGGQRLAHGRGLAWRPCLRCVAAAPAGSTDLVVDASAAPRAPWVGQILGHDLRPFLVTSVTALATAGHHALTVEMPLRAAIAADDPVEMLPFGLFEALDDATGAPGYERQLRARPEFALQEYLNR